MKKRIFEQENNINKKHSFLFNRIYFNTQDKNIFIKRDTPFSWTMNLGNFWSWVIIGAEIFAVILIVWFLV